jgi:signal transduction histidine kinase
MQFQGNGNSNTPMMTNRRKLSLENPNGSLNSQLGGSGMGLAISKHLVERIGPGSLYFFSEVGLGTTFWF